VPRPSAPPISSIPKTPVDKFAYAKSRVTFFETAATAIANAVASALAGGINPASLLAAYQAAYDAAIAAGASDWEAITMAKAAVQGYVAFYKLNGQNPTTAKAFAAKAALAALAGAAAAAADPCNLGNDTASLAAACLSAVDVASIKNAIQYLSDNNG
jgi:hypothetical protein